jgi:hypothetical protein
MVQDHGGDAPRKAQIRADWLEKVGAAGAAEIWRQIAARCADMLLTVRTR